MEALKQIKKLVKGIGLAVLVSILSLLSLAWSEQGSGTVNVAATATPQLSNLTIYHIWPPSGIPGEYIDVCYYFYNEANTKTTVYLKFEIRKAGVSPISLLHPDTSFTVPSSGKWPGMVGFNIPESLSGEKGKYDIRLSLFETPSSPGALISTGWLPNQLEIKSSTPSPEPSHLSLNHFLPRSQWAVSP